MGQQQLLLLVIGVILVGVAVMAALTFIPVKMQQSEADHLVDRNLTIATNAVFWKTKMDPYNGGDASYAGLVTNGLETLMMDATTHLGQFKITSATTNTLEITAVSIRYPDIGVRTYITDYSIDSTAVRYDDSINIE